MSGAAWRRFPKWHSDELDNCWPSTLRHQALDGHRAGVLRLRHFILSDRFRFLERELIPQGGYPPTRRNPTSKQLFVPDNKSDFALPLPSRAYTLCRKKSRIGHSLRSNLGSCPS